MVKDVWLRYLRQDPVRRQVGWDLQVSTTGYTMRKDAPAVLQTRPGATGSVAEVLDQLKGFLGGPTTSTEYQVKKLTDEYVRIGQEALENRLVYGKETFAYIDVENRCEVEAAQLEAKFQELRKRPSKILYPAAYSIPVKLVPSTKGPRSSDSVTLRAKVDRLEHLPGITGYAINNQSAVYESIRNMKAEHPLIPSSASGVERHIPIVGVEDGPNELTPIFAGNDAKSWNIATRAGLPVSKSVDVHGAVNYQAFMPYIANIVRDKETGKQYLAMDNDPENRAQVFADRSNLPIELANQAVYSYLFKRHGRALTKLPPNEDPHDYTVPGYLEPVLVIKYFVDTHQVLARQSDEDLARFAHVASADTLEATPDFAITAAGMRGLHAWQFGLEPSSDAANSKALARIKGRMVLAPWAHPIYDACLSQKHELPLVLERDKNVVHKILLALALSPSLSRSIIVPQHMTQNWTLGDLTALKAGENTALDHKLPGSFDTLRGLLASSLAPTADPYTLTQPLLDDAQGVLSLLYYAATPMPHLAGATPRLPLTDHDWQHHVQTYERYVLFELAGLQETYTEAMAAHDLHAAHEALDSAVILVGGKYRPALACEMFEVPTYERATVASAVHRLVFETLRAMADPFYPALAAHLSSLTAGALAAAPLRARLPVALSAASDQAPGALLFATVDAVEAVLASTSLRRREYRGYVAFSGTPEPEVYGYADRARVNETALLLAKRLTRVRRLTMPSVAQVFNKGRVATTALLPGVYLISFDDRQWLSRAQYSELRAKQRELWNQIEGKETSDVDAQEDGR